MAPDFKPTTQPKPLSVGEPLPLFHARSSRNPRFAFGSMAGRGVLLVCVPAGASPARDAVVAAMRSQPAVFHSANWASFLLCPDATTLTELGPAQGVPEQRVLVDETGEVFARLGVLNARGAVEATAFLLDMRLRVLAHVPLSDDPQSVMQRLAAQIPQLAAQGSGVFEGMHAPVLVVPRVFSPQLCQRLIQSYEQAGGEASGFMRDIEGQTMLVQDAAHKRRLDHMLADAALQQACMHSMRLRLLPQIQRVFQFEATRVERHLVACYSAEEQGHFRRHRDNTTRGTAHRQFAVSLFLNAPSEYSGGQLIFPEYGAQRFGAPAGGAVVFSCGLLHEALPVTQGKRYMYLPFLFNESAVSSREPSQAVQGPGVAQRANDADDADAASADTSQF
jgi:predicted 2-oxoglutarate/Fe(II)-dependent dioxygenase YbiX